MVAPPVPDDVVSTLEMPRLWAQILYNRGIQNLATAREMLESSHNALHDPFLFDDMAIAVRRIQQAIRDDETIAVFGDFDTDGVTATVMLYEALQALGAPRSPTFLIASEMGTDSTSMLSMKCAAEAQL